MYRCAVVVSGFLMTGFCIASQPPMSQLRGGTADLFTRVVATNAAASIGERAICMRAWRGERVHAQTVTFFNGATGSVRFVASSLKSTEGEELPSRNLRVRLVRDVAGVPDRLEDAVETAIPSNGFLSAWVTADVSRSARPGLYEGAVRVTTESGDALSYPVFLEVGVNVLPEQNRFFLDLWQNACAVARYHHVKPYSKAHYALLEPLFRELAAAGQKAITAPICLHPWGKGCLDDEFVPLVKDVRYRDGRCVLDFSDFDAYVAFARSCGIGPQIHWFILYALYRRGWFFKV